MLRATIVLGGLVVAATEALSIAEAITAPNASLLWMVLGALAWGSAFGASRLHHASTGSRTPLSRGLATACAAILVGTFLTAVFSPPTYTDAMTYHMGRVVHWIQRHGVELYPSGIHRQNYQPPFAEFVILHLQLLAGDDQWANLAQWTAFALSGLAVSLILADLRQPSWVQWTGALVLFTTPMAILQSSGAQNDLVVSFWLLAFLLYLQRLLRKGSWPDTVFCGLALGLALLTKGTAFLFATSMGGTLLLFHLVRPASGRRQSGLVQLSVVVLLAAALNLGPWLRNLRAYGEPVCCDDGYFVELLTPADVATNVLRNMALHWGFPGLKQEIVRVVTAVSPGDVDEPGTSFNEEPFSVVFSLDEGRAGNFLLFLLGCVAAITFGRNKETRRGPGFTWFIMALAGFLAFAIPLKWQPWGSRLHTPVFLVLAVPVAILLGGWPRRVARTVLVVLIAGSAVFVLRNEDRPLVPMRSPSIFARSRIGMYFVSRPEQEAAYRQAAAHVRRAREPEIGLLIAENDYEYPFWILLKDDPAGAPFLRHVGTSGRPGGLGHRPLPPPAIVVTTVQGERMKIDGVDFVRVRDFGSLSVLRQRMDAEATSTP